MQSHPMPTPGAMPPPSQWAPQQPQPPQSQMTNNMPQQHTAAGMLPSQAKPPSVMPPGANRPPHPNQMTLNRPSNPSFNGPEMKKAYDALGLSYPGPGNGATNAVLNSHQSPGQFSTYLSVSLVYLICIMAVSTPKAACSPLTPGFVFLRSERPSVQQRRPGSCIQLKGSACEGMAPECGSGSAEPPCI